MKLSIWNDLHVHTNTGLNKKAHTRVRELSFNHPRMADCLSIFRLRCRPHYAAKFQIRTSLFDQRCTADIRSNYIEGSIPVREYPSLISGYPHSLKSY